MPITIQVTPLIDNVDIDFSGFELHHSDCQHPLISKYRNQVTNIYTLNCECGFEMTFSDEYSAIEKIIQVAIDGQQQNLPANSYTANENGPCTITV